jgi:hypothetical protein
MKTQITPLIAAIVCASWIPFEAHSAVLLSDFEGGSSDYDNTNPPATGKFRDTGSGTRANLSNNGAANDFLTLTSGGTFLGSVAYDTTPSDGVTTRSLFTAAVGQTLMVTVDLSLSNNSTNYGMIGLWDGTSAAAAKGFGLMYQIDSSGTQERGSIRQLRQLASTLAGKSGASAVDLANVGADRIGTDALLVNNSGNSNPVRLTLSLTVTTAITGTVSGTIKNLTGGFGGTESDFITLAGGSINFADYGIDPVNTGLELFLYGGPSGLSASQSFDNLNYVIPEPSSASLVIAGVAAGLMAGRRRRRIE